VNCQRRIIIIVIAVMIIIDLSGVDQKLLHFWLLQSSKKHLKLKAEKNKNKKNTEETAVA